VDWLFAYGSLLPAGRARLPDGAGAANLLGWRRSWAVAMDNSVDLPGYKHYVTPDGERPELMVCYLDIAEQAGAMVNGVALAVGVDELPALDARERNYERVEVTGQLDVALDGRVWAYRGARAARARAERGRRERRLAVASSYRERVMAGFEVLGQRRRFEALTAPPGAPVAELAVVHRAPVAVPRTAVRAWRGRGPAIA
jgi:cation transport regulator ChaC